MNNKIKAILMAVAVSSMVLTQGVSAAQFDDGEQVFSDGTDSSEATGSVSALASALAKQTEVCSEERGSSPDPRGEKNREGGKCI